MWYRMGHKLALIRFWELRDDYIFNCPLRCVTQIGEEDSETLRMGHEERKII